MQIPCWFKTHQPPPGLIRQRVFSREKARRTVFCLKSHMQRLHVNAKGSVIRLPRKAKKMSLYVKKAGPARFLFLSCESVSAYRGHRTWSPETPAPTCTGVQGSARSYGRYPRNPQAERFDLLGVEKGRAVRTTLPPLNFFCQENLAADVGRVI